MEDEYKTREQLIKELAELRQQVADFKSSETDYRHVREELARERKQVQTLIDAIPSAIYFKDLSGRHLVVNKAHEELFGMRKEAIIGKTVEEFLPPDLIEQCRKSDEEVIANRKCMLFEERGIVDSEKKYFETIKAPLYDKLGNITGLVGISSEITERKKIEDREQLAREVLDLLNRPESAPDTIRDILLLVKKSMGFEAVGIRLQQGDDFPYYETRGFPEDFVHAERYLCAYDEAGKIVRDGKGNPVLECMCGNVLCGRTNTTLPFFTEGGSFWTNSTTDLLASTTEEDRQSRTRNRCNGEGYESVALIPLRSGSEIIGLLQLNDRRRNLFKPEIIRFCEGLGASIGIALSRKQAEEDLRLHAEIMRNMAEGVILTRVSDCVIVYTNPKFEEMFGYDPGELIGKNISAVNAPTDKSQEEIAKEIQKCLRGKNVWQGEVYNIKKDGTPFWCYANVSTFNHYGYGEVWVAVHTDITERKKAKEALQKSEALLIETQSITKVGGWELDVEKGQLTWTDEVYRIYGVTQDYNPNDIEQDMQFYAPESIPILKEAFQRTLEKCEPYDLELKFIRANGEQIWVRTIGKPVLKDGKVVRITGNFMDITECKRAEEQLRESEATTRAIMNTPLDSVLLLDPHGIIIDSNKTVAQRVGRRIDELIGMCVYDLLPPELVKNRRARIEEVVRLGVPVRFEDEHAGVWFDHSIHPIFDAQGKVARIAVVARNITESKKYEKEALNKTYYLAQLGQLSAGIAHEINNPNNSIMSSSQMLQEIWEDVKAILLQYYAEKGDFQIGGLTFSKAHEDISKLPSGITECARRIKDIIENLKDYAGQRSMRMDTEVQVNKVIADAIILLNNRIRSCTDNFMVDLKGDLPLVKGSSQALEQVVINIIMNALEALPDRKFGVKVSTYFDNKNKFVIIQITDTGKGMSKELCEKVFTPFLTTKRDKGGTGLGLSISYSIIKNHNGLLEFKSKPGKGTTAMIKLPAKING